MEPLGIAAVIVALVAGSTLIGVIGRVRSGRVRESHSTADASELAAPGAALTLVQFSSEVCAPCRAQARVLGEIAGGSIAHREVDVAERTDLVSRWGIFTTPTTFLVDAEGHLRGRISGVARRAEVEAAIEDILGARSDTLSPTHPVSPSREDIPA